MIRRTLALLFAAPALLCSAAAATAAATAAPPPLCFGALARDPLAPCSNPELRLLVRPTPAEAQTLVAQPCPVIGSLAERDICRFGLDPAQASRTVALVGDSHAGMWRLPLDHAAQALGWTVLRVGHAGCPLSTARRDLPEPKRSHCLRWKRAVFTWFPRNPAISTVVVSELSSGRGVYPSGGRSEFETAVSGYVNAWQRLPPTVRHIVVIRDTPKALATTATCIERAMARQVPAGPACSVARSLALPPDPAAVAARRLGDPRVQVLDLTPIFCGAHTCLPVIGGALVLHDTTHLTPTFAESLGEPLLRRLRPLAGSWR